MALMGKYIYCFIKEKEKVSLGNSNLGNLNAPVYTIPYKEISAVVSDAPIVEYDPTRKNILAYEKIIVKVMNKYTILPVAFGTVANNKKDVENIINDNYNRFHDLIDFFKDKMEVGLTITWSKDYFNEDIESDEIKKLKKIVDGKDENKVLNEKTQLGKLVQESIFSKREEYNQSIYNPLKQLSVDSNIKEKLPIKTVLNAYFLIEKAKVANFDKNVEALADLYKDKLVFNYTGPWPPYNFVDINVN
jgi:hypothetical protein